jgi:CO/xanthine dehydrogenase FAD-binding subunit
VGGNLATCSPAGDGLPVFSALEAEVQLVGAEGRRSLPVADFMLGVKRTALAPDEIIESISLPLLDGWQGYSKVGVRNAMVIATASACLATDRSTRSIRLALGSVAPTIVRAPEAESFALGRVDWEASAVSDEAVARFGELAAAASRPIDDHRSTAAYRRHAIAVMSARLLRRAFPTEAP